jgi:hypothetical protein
MVVVVEVQLLLEQLLLDLKQAQVELEQRLQLMELQLLEQEEVVVDHNLDQQEQLLVVEQRVVLMLRVLQEQLILVEVVAEVDKIVVLQVE